MSQRREIIASLALLCYSIVVAAGFARVFSGWGFFDNLVVIAVAGHGIALVLRLARVPIWMAFPTTVVALIWLIGAMFYRETYTLLLPTSQTYDLFRLELDVVGDQFRSAVAPVAFLAGWNVLAAIGVAAAVVLSDTFAFRAYARAESLVPGGVLFVFVAALGTDRSRVASTMALIGAGVVATIVLRNHHAPERTASIGRARGTSTSRALPAALGSALCIALVAGFVGPRLPGANAEPLYETKGGDGGTVTEVISPLVDIRSRLTNRSETELFVVRADSDSYWRSSALASFDGRRWGIPTRSLTRTDSVIGQATDGAVTLRQEIQITNLGGVLLPAAADPIRANGRGDLQDDLRWNIDSATLVKTGGDLATGDVFVVESASPRFTAERLTAATSIDPGDEIYFELPDDFPSSVRETTLDVVGDAATSYEIALRLQDWMRDEFDYSLEIQEGHGNNEIESFLRNRVGYCEQFAGTYAAMLRSIGIPARVAVGFTPGSNDGSGNYSVRGRNAHAWPEVWFDGLGWVPFEPTPGRGAPNAQDYTGIEPQQDDSPLDSGGDQGDAIPVPAPTTAAPTTIVDPTDDPTVSTVPAAPTGGAAEPDEPPTPIAGGVDGDLGALRWQPVVAILLLGLLLAGPAVLRRVRRAALTSPEQQLASLWERSTGALTEMGLEPAPHLTPLETARATSEVFPVAARPMMSLADVVTVAGFAPDGIERLATVGAYNTTTLQTCTSWCRQVERAVGDSLQPAARLRRYFTVLR